MYSKATEAAASSVNKVKSWINRLPSPSSTITARELGRSLSSACVNIVDQFSSEDPRETRDPRPSSAPIEKIGDSSRPHLNNLMQYCRKAFGEVGYETPEQPHKSSGANTCNQTGNVFKTAESFTDSGIDHNSVQDEPTFRHRSESVDSVVLSTKPASRRSLGTESTYNLEEIGCRARSSTVGSGISQATRINNLIPKGAYTGRMKLCLQYFESSRILRVILLRALDLKVQKGHVYAKLSIQCCDSKTKFRKLKLRKVKALTNVVFNEEAFFENIDEAMIDELILTVRLYNKEGFFKTTKRLGEMMIPVFKYDLSMDTNVWGNLRLSKRNKQQAPGHYDDDDIDVISEDRSIHASVAASVKPPAALPSPVRRRVNPMKSSWRFNHLTYSPLQGHKDPTHRTLSHP